MYRLVSSGQNFYFKSLLHQTSDATVWHGTVSVQLVPAIVEMVN
jgi:hypothetical protein